MAVSSPGVTFVLLSLARVLLALTLQSDKRANVMLSLVPQGLQAVDVPSVPGGMACFDAIRFRGCNRRRECRLQARARAQQAGKPWARQRAGLVGSAGRIRGETEDERWINGLRIHWKGGHASPGHEVSGSASTWHVRRGRQRCLCTLLQR
ncbi:hypothetical protein DDF84_029810 [Cupriavidus metallidurans]|uniref:Uncharacterized protein n=1 Tax=Cupriavidus metallidurans TaxID=119219 RepID=A0A482IZC0_9BURK|nr:hypothetical protein DDF84_029810 [Cupriavidus metallidurans]